MTSPVFDWFGDESDITEVEEKLSSKHFPTPPRSLEGSPILTEELDIKVSVSTTFYPGAKHSLQLPDVVLLSSDSVFFYVHSHRLIEASNNDFRSLLSFNGIHHELDPSIPVSETSEVLNIILHAIYEMSCAHYAPSLPALIHAVNQLSSYGVAVREKVAPSKPLFSHLLSHAPLFPIDIYTLAASLDIYDLAVAASSHLLSFPLFTLSDDITERIGPVYLKRLFFLHLGRLDALKRVLLPPPHPHVPSRDCDAVDQKTLSRAWALATASLVWDARPDLSTSMMESSLRSLSSHIQCGLCKLALEERIKMLSIEWAAVKRTI